MSFEEPYLKDKEELAESLQKLMKCYSKWYSCKMKKNDDKESKKDFEEKTMDLRRLHSSITLDLAEFEDTYSIFNTDPQTTNLSKEEILERENFVNKIKEEVQVISEDLFNSKNSTKESSVLDKHLSHPIGYYSLVFDSLNGKRYKRLGEEKENSNNNQISESAIQITPYDSHMPSEVEQMMEDGNGDLNNHLINDFGYSSGDYSQVYQPTLNVVDYNYDSPFKRWVREMHWSKNKRNKYIITSAVGCTVFIISIFVVFL